MTFAVEPQSSDVARDGGPNFNTASIFITDDDSKIA